MKNALAYLAAFVILLASAPAGMALHNATADTAVICRDRRGECGDPTNPDRRTPDGQRIPHRDRKDRRR